MDVGFGLVYTHVIESNLRYISFDWYMLRIPQVCSLYMWLLTNQCVYLCQFRICMSNIVIIGWLIIVSLN